MGKVESNKKKKQEALLNTAFDLFMSKGINETSISDIVSKAGVAKGTFYLYFRDKYDIRNLLISHKSSQLFMSAHNALLKEDTELSTEDKIIFITNHIIDELKNDKSLLTFISKNLSWGFFKKALMSSDDTDVNFMEVYQTLINESNYTFKEPELMLFMIIELVSSTCYSTILYQEPVDIETLKPYLNEQIRNIVKAHVID